MIESDEQLRASQEVLLNLERSLRVLQERVEAKNPALYAAMAQDYVRNITQIRTEIDGYLGVPRTSPAAAPLWIALEGDQVRLDDLSSEVLSGWLHRIRTAVVAIAEFLENTAASKHKREKKTVRALCDFRLLAFERGSVRLGLTLPSGPYQLDLVEEGKAHGLNPAELALGKVLRAAVWAVSQANEDDWSSFTESDEEKKLVAKELLKLTPTKRSGIQGLRFEGALLPSEEPVTLVTSLRPRIEAAARDEEEVKRSYTGTVREIDLDKHHIKLRELVTGPPEVHCVVPEELIEEAEDALNKKVQIVGFGKKDTPSRIRVSLITPVS